MAIKFYYIFRSGSRYIVSIRLQKSWTLHTFLTKEMMVVINVWRKHQHGKVNFDSKSKPRILFMTLFVKYCKLLFYSDGRESNVRVRLPRGKYCIIPSTFLPEQEGDFILRVHIERYSREEVIYQFHYQSWRLYCVNLFRNLNTYHTNIL